MVTEVLVLLPVDYSIESRHELSKEIQEKYPYLSKIVYEYDAHCFEPEIKEGQFISSGKVDPNSQDKQMVNWYQCPGCLGQIRKTFNYCSECGMRLIWEK